MNRVIVPTALSAVFVLIAAAGLAMFWKSKPKDTPIRENAFRLTLPGKWVQKPSSDPTRWVYQTEDGRAQLTVSLILVFNHRLSNDEQKETLDRVVDLHRRAQTKMSNAPAVTLAETTFAEINGVLGARYLGVGTAGHLRFASLLLCSPVALTTYYYEALDSTEAEFG